MKLSKGATVYHYPSDQMQNAHRTRIHILNRLRKEIRMRCPRGKGGATGMHTPEIIALLSPTLWKMTNQNIGETIRTALATLHIQGYLERTPKGSSRVVRWWIKHT